MREFVVFREIGIDDAPLLRRAHHGGQAVIGLRADHDIDDLGPAQDLLALGLGDAAGDDDPGLDTLLGPACFQRAQASELGIDLLCRLLADMAGIEHDEIGILGGIGLLIAVHGERIGHALGIVDVHLAAVGFDEYFFQALQPLASQ